MDEIIIAYLNEIASLPEYLSVESVSIDTISTFGNTPLHMAVVQGRVDVVNALLNYGVDPNVKGDCGYTPLHDAVEQGNIEIMHLLLKCERIDISIKNDIGLNVIDFAQLLGVDCDCG